MLAAYLLLLVSAPAEPLYTDALTGLAGAFGPAGDWLPLRGDWAPAAAGLTAGPDESVALLQAVPLLDQGTLAVTITPRRRQQTGGWATAVLALWEAPDRYWQVGLVEDPDGRTRRTEAIEMHDGTWQAQTQGPTRLTAQTTGDGRWVYDQPYRITLRWEATRLSATVQPLGGSGAGWSTSFAIPAAADAVRVGRPALKTTGLVAEYRDLQVEGQPARSRRVTGLKAVLVDGPGPWQTAAWKATAAAWGKLLAAAGYEVRPLAPGDLASGLDRTQDGLVAVPSLEALPATVATALAEWTAQGGDLLASGGEPFAKLLYPTPAGAWADRRELLAAVKPRRTVLEPATTRGLQRSSNQPAPAPTLSPGANGPSGQANALHVAIPKFTGWDVVMAPAYAASPFGPDCVLTVVTVKGTPGQAITVEWREADHTRWVASVPLSDQWRTHVLEPTDFGYWKDGSPPERQGTVFRPSEARQLQFGPAVGQGATAGQPIEYTIAPVGVAPSPLTGPVVTVPTIETISPWYKQFSATKGKESVRYPIIRPRGLSAAPELDGRYSVVGDLHRPTASRYLTATGAALVWLPAAVLPEPEQAPVVALLKSTRSGLGLLNAGPPAALARPDQPLALAARILNTTADPAQAAVAWTVRQGKTTVQQRQASLSLAPGGVRGVVPAEPVQLAAGEYLVETTLTVGKELVDRVEAELRVAARPAPEPTRRVKVANGRLVANDQRLFLHGVNYWPRLASGLEIRRYGTSWLTSENYDPAIIEADLAALQSIGMNLVSINYSNPAAAPNVMDFLDRCRKHGIWANLFLGPAHPLNFDPVGLTRLLEAAELPGNTAIFAYDLAWEPRLGLHAERRRWDSAWRDWIVAQYGDLATAEATWGQPAPRDEQGQVTNPSDAQITGDGAHRVMVAAYRRFADDLISRGYRRVVQHLRRLDPDVLLGVRTGYGGTMRASNNRVMGYDLVAGATWLDFTSPEGYGMPPAWADARQTGFVSAYARWAGHGKPVFWSEFGASLGPRGGTPQTRANQLLVWETTLRMISDSDADASAGWWWPGGWRLNELSDYGVFAPDGQIREPARRAADLAKEIQTRGNAAGSGEPVLITIDRDADARGMLGLLTRHGEAYVAAREAGRPVRVVTAGTGTTTATMPRLQVGGVAWQGTGPLAHANAEIAAVTVTWPGGQASLENGGEVTVPAGARCRVTVELANTGEATWLPAGGPGGVSLRTSAGEAPLTTAVPRCGLAPVAPLDLVVSQPTEVTGRPAVGGLGAFGEGLLVRLVPQP